jgi:hypothetical protein
MDAFAVLLMLALVAATWWLAGALDRLGRGRTP